MRSTIITAAMVLALGTGASAQERLAGGNLFGGPGQTRAVCLFYNTGGQRAVRIRNFEITNQNGAPLALVIDQCTPIGGLIQPGRTCGIAADINFQVSISCRAIVADKTNMRGVLDIREGASGGGNVLANTELR